MASLQGKLLLAAPAMVDPNFARSVVLIVRHDGEGALGLVLNRPTGAMVKEAIESGDGWACTSEAELLRGGPCDGPLMVLHSDAELAQETVLAGVYFSVESDLVRELLSGEVMQARFFHGYAGWAAGQLDAEMAAGGWLTLDATVDNVFEPGMDAESWSELMKQRGREELKGQINPNLIPPDPTVN
ncbi:MAG: YqgE/AlgH family protein [Phycisphaerales bacterium]